MRELYSGFMVRYDQQTLYFDWISTLLLCQCVDDFMKKSNRRKEYGLDLENAFSVNKDCNLRHWKERPSQ